MSALFASPANVLSWLRSIAQSQKLVAPKMQGAKALFLPWTIEELKNVTDVEGFLKRTVMSPKEVIFPKEQTLYTFTATKDEKNPAILNQLLEVPCDVEDTVIFALRPCDAKGFIVLDRPFLQGPYVDPYYKARRDKTCIVTQACESALPTCFCHWFGGHTSDSEGSDIIFTKIDDGFLFRDLTEKGTALLANAGFTKASAEQVDAETKAHEKASQSLSPQTFNKESTPAKLLARFTDEEFWTLETAKCLSCGACTYLCPTCQCFGISDEGNALRGKRFRVWSGCMTPLFTMEASGHNPRDKKSKRMRNRIGHKFSYYPTNYDGKYSCVGCGRCIRSCPASLDIRSVVLHAADESTSGKK